MVSPIGSPGLREKLVGLAMLVLVPLTLMQALVINARLSERMRSEQEHGEVLAQAVGASFERYLGRIWETQLRLGERIIQFDPAAPGRRTSDLLAEHAHISPSLFGLMWLNADGTLAASTLTDNAALVDAARECYQTLVGGAQHVLSNLIRLPDGRPVVLAASAVRTDGHLAGVAVFGIDPRRLAVELPLVYAGTESVLLVDRAGTIVFHGGQDSLLGPSPTIAPESPVRQALDGVTAVFDRATLGAAVPVSEVGWAAVATSPWAAILGPAYRSAGLQMMALTAILIASLAAAMYLGRRILHPILALTEAASRIAAGDMQARVGTVTSHDEVAAAVRTFDAMAEQIEALQVERERFYTLSAALLGTVDFDGRVRRTNPEWERTLGLTQTELTAMSAADLVHPADRRSVSAIFAELMKQQTTAEFECRLRCKDGTWKWFVWGASSTTDRRVIYLVGQDITANKQAETERIHLLHREQSARAAAEDGQRRLSFLAEASNMLASSIDYQTTLANVAQLAVPRLADWCSVSIVNSEGILEPIAVAYDDPGRTEGTGAHLPDRSATLAAFSSGKSVLVPDTDRPEYPAVLRQQGIRSTIMVPMMVRSRSVGMIHFAYAESGRRYSREDLALGEELATRAALAVENALLYRESQAAAARAEEALALLDTLLESAPVGIAFLDPYLRYVRVNDALAAMNGVAADKVVGQPLSAIVPQIAAHLEPIAHRVIRSGEPVVAWESSGIDSEGTPRHMLESIYPVRTKEGKVLGVGIMVTDITERTRIEEALRESESLLTGQKQVLEMIATGAPLKEIQDAIVRFIEAHIGDSICAVCLIEPGGGLAFGAAPHLSAAYQAAVVGSHPDAESCMCCRAAFHGTPVIVPDVEADPLWRDLLPAVQADGIRSAWAAPILAADGEALGVLAIYHRERREPWDREHNLVEVFAHLAGIAIERHNAEEARNRKLESLIDHMAEGVIAVDEGGRLIVVNAAARQLLDLPPLVGTPTMDAAGLPQALLTILLQASRPESVIPARYTMSQGPAELDVHVSPVVAGLGRHYGAIALIQDVTAIAQFRRLQESFVANVSHELRAPLASLSAMAEAINDGVGSEEMRGRYVKAILSEAERLRRLTNDILELSRLDAGVVEISQEEFDLDLVLESIEESWSLRYASAGVELLVERSGYRVIADYDRVLQVLTNLVDNAVKFTPRGGTVGVYAESGAARVRVCVADTGQGIPAEHLPYVWQRFYMMDRARTRTPGNGTGLGLAIARHLVENMGGEVGVESTPGMGSTFWFTLPVA